MGRLRMTRSGHRGRTTAPLAPLALVRQLFQFPSLFLNGSGYCPYLSPSVLIC
jgi:hypothetical protein